MKKAMNKRLLFILVFIGLFSIFFLVSKDYIAGIAHFGWESGDNILKRDLNGVIKIEFGSKSDGPKLEFSDPNDIDEMLKSVSLKGMPSKTRTRGRYDLKFYTSDGKTVIINLAQEPILEGFAFKYTSDFKKLFDVLCKRLSTIDNKKGKGSSTESVGNKL